MDFVFFVLYKCAEMVCPPITLNNIEAEVGHILNFRSVQGSGDVDTECTTGLQLNSVTGVTNCTLACMPGYSPSVASGSLVSGSPWVVCRAGELQAELHTDFSCQGQYIF